MSKGDRYELHLPLNPGRCRVLRNGEPVPKVREVRVRVRYDEPTTLVIEQLPAVVHVTGHFDRVERVRRGELHLALTQIGFELGCRPRTVRRCRVCGCTDLDCSQCIEATGEPCFWVEADLCSRCAGISIQNHDTPQPEGSHA